MKIFAVAIEKIVLNRENENCNKHNNNKYKNVANNK